MIDMNCEAFEKIVVELAHSETRGILLEAAVRQTGLQHAQSCVRCAGRLKTEQTLSQSLRAVATSDQSLNAPAAMETSLLAAFRQRAEAAPMAAKIIAPTVSESLLKLFFMRLKWAFAPVAVAAAIALIAFAVLRATQPTTSPQKNIAAATPTPKTPVTPAAPEQVKAPLPEPEALRVVVANHRAPRLPLQVKANPNRPLPIRRGDRVTVDVGPFELDEPEAVSAKDFLVFDYAQNLPPADSVQLMRVRMPRERLAPLGIPLPNKVRNENFVNADFLVGSDGVPRAIRVANR